MKSLLIDDIIRSYSYLLKWLMLAVISGFVGSTVVHFFIIFLQYSVEQVSSLDIPIFLIPLIGALISALVIYKLSPESMGEGVPAYIQGMRYNNGRLPLPATIAKFFAALSTMGTLGSGGIVGPLGRVSAGLMSFGMLKWKEAFSDEKNPDLTVAAICGMASVVGAIFHSPIGAGLFAVEVIRRANMAYRDLFPAILASSTAVYVSKAFGWDRFYYLPYTDQFMDLDMIWALLVLAVATGFCGSIYTSAYQKIKKIFGRQEGNTLIKVLIGSLIAGLIGWAVNPGLMGTSNELLSAMIYGKMEFVSGNLPSLWSPALILLIMVILKGLTNLIVVGSGMSAGFTGPAALMGMMLGAAFAHVFGVEVGSPTYYAFVAAGFSGMLASSMNVPLAAAVMAPELFGVVFAMPAAIASVVGFQMTRHKTIYDDAVERELIELLNNKTEE